MHSSEQQQHNRGVEPMESSCTTQNHHHTWKPFKTLLVDYHSLSSDPKLSPPPPHHRSSSSFNNNNNNKRPCLSDRTTTTVVLESHLSRLSLFDDSSSRSHLSSSWKRRRRCSRSVSGRSSDRSRPRCCSVGAGTCSDLPVATGGTDSSGELFLNGGDGNWGSDVSEASRGNNRREREERESLGSASGVVQIGSIENQGNESGYGSEPGYRGDAEIGYGDEVDTEEDEHRLSVWGDKFQGRDTKMEIAGETTLQKAHHRCRRKKHDVRMVDALG